MVSFSLNISKTVEIQILDLNIYSYVYLGYKLIRGFISMQSSKIALF